MKVRVWLGLRIITSVTAIAAIFFTATQVTASNDSLWVNGGIPSRVLVARDITSSNSPYFERSTCDKTPQYANKYRWNGSKQVYVGRLDITNPYLCWTKTSFGIITTSGNDGYIRFGNLGAVSRISFGGGTTIFLPQTNKYIQNYGTPGIYIYDLQKSDYVSTYGGDPVTDYYSRTADPSYWVPKNPVTNRPIVVGSMGYSNNGEWLAVESDYFTRINVKTHEILTFGKVPQYQAGYGTPHHSLAISNDGRYAITSVGGNFQAMFRLYDLSTCTPVAGDPMALSTGCQSRDMLPVTAQDLPGAPNNASAGYIEFSDDGQSISYNAMENGQLNRYMITAPGQGEHLLDYLALGDSYSSGEGDTDGGRYYVAGTDGNGEAINNTGIADFPYWLEKCHQSSRSYPFKLAALAGLSGSVFKSVACSGATKDDILGSSIYLSHFKQLRGLRISDDSKRTYISSAIQNFIPGRAAQVEFVQKYRPKVATIGIGGNDIGFADKIRDCIAFTADTCHFATTERYYTGLEIRSMYQKLTNLYGQLKSVSPTTKFYAVGYPQIVSTGTVCFGVNVNLDMFERIYINKSISYLNQVIKAAANKAGFYYLDIENSLAGHELCDVNLNNDVNGLKLGNDLGIGGQQSQHFGIIGDESFHPNDAGHARTAAAISSAMNGASIVDFQPCGQPVLVCWPNGSIDNTIPAIPGYFSDGNAAIQTEVHPIQGAIGATIPVVVDGINAVKQASDTVINTGAAAIDAGVDFVTKFKPGSIVSINIHSNPTTLGTMTADANGDIHGDITLPAMVKPGYHTIHMVGVLESNDNIDLYQDVFVYGSLDDLDGDGIQNDQDTCGFVAASGMNADNDGQDDACDGYIGEVEQHPLYRVRQGDEAGGEVTSRFYVERDVLEAKSKLSIVNDSDPDGDGWAVVGHTEGDYDGATQTQFWIDNQNTPHLLLNGDSSVTCGQLTPVSLAVVVAGEDRLLKTEDSNLCPEPELVIVPEANSDSVQEPTLDPIQDTGLITNTTIDPQLSAVQTTLIVTDATHAAIPTVLAESVQGISQLPQAMAAIPSINQPDSGYVAGTSTAIPGYIDAPSKYSAEITNQISSSFLIGASIIIAVALGIVLLIKLLTFFIH